MKQTELPARIDVVGTAVSATSYDEVLQFLLQPPRERARVIAVCNVHSIMTARRNDAVRQALDDADIATPDGVPVVWAMRGLHGPQERVYGPELMRRAFSSGLPLRHYLYGTTPDTIAKLTSRLPILSPETELVGWYAPPFRALYASELEHFIEEIKSCRPDVIWVGLGMPKQELWMHNTKHRLPGVTLIGVGAAFDILAGNVRSAPVWMQRAGLEWVFRLIQEPRRLWRRYLASNPLYLVLIVRQVVAHRLRQYVAYRRAVA